MKRWVYAYTVVNGSPERLDKTLREHVRELLLRATDTPPTSPAADGSVPLRLEAGFGGSRNAKRVRARIAVAEVVGGRTRIGLTWHAEPGRQAFPVFDGAIELEPLSSRNAQLSLVGAYRAPFGPVGAAIDGISLHGIAARTVRGLVDRLGEALEGHVREGGEVVGEPVPRGPVPLRVRDVMTPDPMVFDEELSLRSAALLLIGRGVQGAPVVSETGALLGVLSEQDLLDKEAALRASWTGGGKDERRRRAALTAGEACSRPALVTVADALLRDAAREMLDQRVARLVVVEGSAIAGILTRHDVLKALLRADAELQAAVDALIAGDADVEASVLWGEVTLTGTAPTRSRAEALLREVAEIDGVLAVHGEPGWREDDIGPLLHGMHGF